MRPTFNRVIAQDLRGVLPRIKASTLLIWGTEDRDTPLWMGEVMEKEIPTRRSCVWRAAGISPIWKSTRTSGPSPGNSSSDRSYV